MSKWINLARKNSTRNVFNMCAQDSVHIKTHIKSSLAHSVPRVLTVKVDDSIDFSIATELQDELKEYYAVK